jgi:hypothetical protein
VTSQIVFYDERTKRVAVSFWALNSFQKTTLTQTAWLTLGEAQYLVAGLDKTLASIPPEPRTVSAEDLGL